jgi:aminoglycoside phosphotransferase (APT) family kinase protein
MAHRIEPGGELRTVTALEGGISASMSVLEIARSDGQTRRVVLRIPSADLLAQRPTAASDEFGTIQALFATGARVPEPLFLDESGAILSLPYMVLSYIEGETIYDPPDRCGYERRRAEELASIHALNLAVPGLASLRRRPHAFASRIKDRPPDPNSPLDEERIHAALEPFWDRPAVNRAVLLHGDLWPGNLLWKDGDLSAVVDWEDAEIGDPLADLAICRLDSLLIFGRPALDAFTERYLSITRANTRHLPYWDLCAALRAAPAIAIWASYFPSLGRADITEETMRGALQAFADEALERLPEIT